MFTQYNLMTLRMALITINNYGSKLPKLLVAIALLCYCNCRILFTEDPTSNYVAYIPTGIRVYARSLTSYTNQGPAPTVWPE